MLVLEPLLAASAARKEPGMGMRQQDTLNPPPRRPAP